MVNNKNAPLSFTGKGTWVVKKDTIDSGVALFLEFTETKGTCSTDEDKIENRYVFLDKDDKRFYSLIYLKEEKRYEPYECFDKINPSKK